MASTEPGFFGKLPSRGDYVAQGLPRTFLDPFEAWLNRALAASQGALGARWPELFAASPPWRFALSAGLCGEEAVAGVMLPSVDRAGRPCPLVMAAPLAGRVPPVEVATRAAPWFERARQLGRAMIDGRVELGAAGRFLVQLGAPALSSVPAPSPLLGAPAPGFRVAGSLPQNPLAAMGRMLHAVAGATYLGYSLWWTEGASGIEASLLLCDGLPAPERFAAFIDGRWAERGWAES
jgi:type VI secretion system protein ImpM